MSVQIPILSGCLGSEQAEFRTSSPTNLEPVAVDNKLSHGQLRMTAGAVPVTTGPGLDRGAIVWNGVHYRVMGTKLVSVEADGTVTTIGDVGGEGQAGLDYGFDRLRIRSGTDLYYYDGMTLAQVTDEDLGPVVDMLWVDGFTMATDGTSVVVTELSDPFEVKPLKYGSAEADPDPITGLMRVEANAEVHFIGRYTIQPARNVGGNGFPFATIRTAVIPYGCVSATAKTYFSTSYAFVGSARNEGLRVFIAGQGDAQPISTREVEDALACCDDPTSIVMETRAWRGEQRLLVHLPDETWVFMAEASQKFQIPVWYRAQSGAGDPYRLRNAVLVGEQTWVGDLASTALGRLSDGVSSHFGDAAQWRFDVGLIDGPCILHSVELKGLPGRGPSGEEPIFWLSWTRDGETFTAERRLDGGRTGNRLRRIVWRPHARIANYAGLRFRGFNHAMPGFARCDAEMEPLNG